MSDDYDGDDYGCDLDCHICFPRDRGAAWDSLWRPLVEPVLWR